MRRIAEALGFEQKTEYQLIKKDDFAIGKGGEVDFVWLKKIPLVEQPVPVVGFEIETSGRASKHLKGDVYNLFCLHSALGVVLFIKEGFADSKLEGAKAAVKRYSELLFRNARILTWTDEDVEKIDAEKLEQEMSSSNKNT